MHSRRNNMHSKIAMDAMQFLFDGNALQQFGLMNESAR
jgi:hypothetical protein